MQEMQAQGRNDNAEADGAFPARVPRPAREVRCRGMFHAPSTSRPGPELRADVLVVGAGPAGSTTAARLAAAGHSVLIVDARRFPRFKACGEFMSPECLPILRELGVHDRLLDAGARRVRGMRMHAHGHTVTGRFVDVGRAIAHHDHGFAVRREVFDELLLRSAVQRGAEFLPEHRAIRLLRAADGAVEGIVARGAAGEDVRIRARWTIGADGVRSRIAGELGVRREVPWLRRIALVARFGSVPFGDQAEVHLFPGGFVAAAPVDGGLVSVNLILDEDVFAESALPRDAAFETGLARIPELHARLARGKRVDPVRGVGPLAASTTRQTFDGAALVGDACGYADPLTGEGIFFALSGGVALADALLGALAAQRTDASALAGYVAARRREIEPRVRMSFLLQRALRHPLLVKAAFSLLERRPRVADVIVSTAGDYVPLRELARPSVWLRALNAA